MIPTTCRMPDVRSECKPLLPTLVLVVTFFEDPSKEFGLYRRLFVHWVDKAIAEYEQARQALLAQIDEGARSTEEMVTNGRAIYLFAFADSIEECLVLARRLLRVLERISGSRLLPIDRTLRRYIEAQAKDLVDARDFVEHPAEIVSGGGLPDQGSIIARLTNDEAGIEIGGRTISFDQIAGLLRRFHALAQQLVDVNSGLEKNNVA